MEKQDGNILGIHDNDMHNEDVEDVSGSHSCYRMLGCGNQQEGVEHTSYSWWW